VVGPIPSDCFASRKCQLSYLNAKMPTAFVRLNQQICSPIQNEEFGRALETAMRMRASSEQSAIAMKTWVNRHSTTTERPQNRVIIQSVQPIFFTSKLLIPNRNAKNLVDGLT